MDERFHGAEAALAAGDVARPASTRLDLGARTEGNGRWSPLEEALYRGNEAAVSLLLERGAPIANLSTTAAPGDSMESLDASTIGAT